MGDTFSIPDYETKEEYFQSSTPKESNRNSFFGGPLGLGDPEDNYLYRKEIKMGIPAKRKEIILDEYCSQPDQDYSACREQNRILGRFRCKNENLERTQCMRRFWNLPGLEERAYNEYLAARSHFRQTGESNTKIPKWIQATSLTRKTWEQYYETKDDNFSLWQMIKNYFTEQEPPDISVPIDSKPLNDS